MMASLISNNGPTASSDSTTNTSETFHCLLSTDGKRFRISEKAVRLSIVIRELLDNCTSAATAGNGDEQFYKGECDGDTLALVVSWLEHHKDDQAGGFVEMDEKFEETQAWDEFREGELPAWDNDFFSRIDLNTGLWELLRAANFLDIKNLQAYASKVIAKQVEGKSVEEMRQIFGINANDEPWVNEQ